MGKKGFTLVEIMIVVAIIALLSAIAIPNLMSARRTANQAAAKSTLKSFNTASETYAISNGGLYPDTVAKLTAFIASAGNYCADAAGTGTVVQGYTYSCTLASNSYTFVASPAAFGSSGSVTYTGSTGGALTPL